MIRIYLPATAADLAALHRDGALPADGAYAVTEELRAELAEDGRPADEEQCEYVAASSAAYAALLRLAESPGARPRRIVVAADLPATRLDAEGPGVFALSEPVPARAVAAILVDGPSAEADTAAAVSALTGGGEPGDAVLGALDQHDLEWYDPTELAVLTDALTDGATGDRS